MSGGQQAAEPLKVHGLDLSYFTGKLEAYLRAKGIAYQLLEMDLGSFRRAGRATGYLQMPQVELSDGRWLTDTTLILRYFEAGRPEPSVTPPSPLMRFAAQLLEDFGDEGLWRPALYYRWAFADDARLMSGRIAKGMLRDMPLPFFVRRQIIYRRQGRVYLTQDGVTPANRAAIEQLYFRALDAMEEALSNLPFVLGARPTLADFGLFGSMFRHFFSDPTPGHIMRARAPLTMAWVSRLWALKPAAFDADSFPDSIPTQANGLFRLMGEAYLPYLAANAAAAETGAPHVTFACLGAEFTLKVNPYHLWCLAELQSSFHGLSASDQSVIAGLVGASAEALSGRVAQNFLPQVPVLPITPKPDQKVKDRSWS